MEIPGQNSPGQNSPGQNGPARSGSERRWPGFEDRFPVRLNAQQREAAQTVDGPVLLLAVPGSGKTTVLVARLGYMVLQCGIAPENILTVTYTVAATQDMRRRFSSFFGEELGQRMEFRTINGICAKIIAYCSRMAGRTPFRLVTQEKQTAAVLSKICEEVKGERPTEAELKDLRTQITYIKNMMLTREEIGRLQEPEAIAEIYARYSGWLRDSRLMDYDDQMVYACNMLRRYPQVLAHFQDQYRYICVDEAQDTSRIQHVILGLLSSRSHNLFMVGDEDQSIYGFRAAYPEALTGFEKDHPGAKVLLMEENFRSTGSLVGAADAFIQKNTLRHDKSMHTSRERGLPVREISLKGRRAQYTYLAKAARDCESSTAVLYRNNESAVALVDLLDCEGIPFRIRNAEMGFFTHRTVMDIRCVLRLCIDPADREAFLRIYYKFDFYLKKEQAARICDYSADRGISVFDAAIGGTKDIKGNPLGLHTKAIQGLRTFRTHLRIMKNERGDEAIERIVKYMGYGDYLGGSGMRDNKIFILRTIGARTASPAELLQRLDELREIFENKPDDPSCPFVLSTIHASKGLEYDTVYLMDVMDGIFPESAPESVALLSDKERAAFEEERRIFYVGLTRAKNRLNVFTTSAESLFADQLFGRSRSRGFVREEPAYAALSKKREVPPEKLREYTDQLGEGLIVRHKKYGEGTVSWVSLNKVSIVFEEGEKTFSTRALCANKLLEF